MAAGMIARSGTITLEDVRAQDHGLVYGTRNMGHFVAFLRKDGRSVDLCPERLAGALSAALAGDDSIGRPPSGSYRVISRRRNGMMNSSLTETSGIIGGDETQDTVEINRSDAIAAGISEGDRLELQSSVGKVSALARLSDAIRPGTVVMAQGWGSPVLDPASPAEVFRRGNERNKLVSDADLDPLSAVPRLNGTLVSITADPSPLSMG